MTRSAHGLVALLGVCLGCDESGTLLPPEDASAPPSDAAAAPDPCADAGVPAATLECAGLYVDFASKTVSHALRPYAPAVSLWSDGADKVRWIRIPPGSAIDASDPEEWVFPVGTTVFKQFSLGGKRVETRMFQKVAVGAWVHATYAWNASESATRISYGEEVPALDGGTWRIPTPQDCDDCHHGRTDRILGFEAVNLGLEGAGGLTLGELAAEGLIEPAPRTGLRIGDDGTGFAAPALAWLHVNCGVTCHNANEGAQGYGAGMRLRLDPARLDGTPASSAWDPLRTTVGVPCVSGSVAGQPRIQAGDPSASVVVELIGQRGSLQMPPSPLSKTADDVGVAAISSWIAHMPTSIVADAGTVGEAGDTGDAAGDSSVADAIAQAPDATAPDAGADDASIDGLADVSDDGEGGDDGG